MARLTRRDFITTSAAATAAACASRAQTADNAEPTRGRPNVLLIITDQQRHDCLGVTGNPDLKTQHIDSIAAHGVTYTHCVCPYPVCTPSRYSMISGRYVHEHRGHTNHCTLPPDIASFPQMLRDAGYRTKCVGKMHYTPTYLDVGYEEMVLAEQNGPGRWDDDFHRDLRAHGLVNASDLEDQEQPWRGDARQEYWDSFGALPSNLPKQFHSTEWIGDRAQESVASWEGGGNFLAVSFIKPHHPFEPPKEYCSHYDPDTLAVLPGWRDTCFPEDLELGKGYFGYEKLSLPALRQVMAYYYANIHHIDDKVGELLAVLKAKGLYDNTLIVFTSDHGEYLGCRHLLLKGNYMYDPVVRVPLVIKYPNGARAGERSDLLANSIDLAPTVLETVGLKRDAGMSGLNLGDSDASRGIVFSESHHGEQVMARTHTRKLLRHRGKKQNFLYDLEMDPIEHVNVYDNPAYAQDVKTLTAAQEAWRPLDMRYKAHVDEEALVIDQPNVPKRNDGHRDEMIAYMDKGMKDFYAKAKGNGA